jgi:hypothetical protein
MGSNNQSVFVCNGASNHTAQERELHDFYATEPLAAQLLLDVEKFKPTIWECACGAGHLSKVFIENGYNVLSTDMVDRGYGIGGVDFLKVAPGQIDLRSTDIITNPPYSLAKEFVEHALELLPQNGKLAMFLKLTFMESKARKQLFVATPPYRIYVSSSRLQCAKNGDFETYSKGVGTAVAYGWYVWIKGFKGDTTVKWIN